ncbi:MAG: GNAT family N-acetyltransferase [Planctomycetes bacterium]|nr:GNAT family N-acetyltransferase [Planctomycetota bacterium]
MTTITYLEMRDADKWVLRKTRDPKFTVRESLADQWQESRSFYLAVGEQWQWQDQRDWTEAQWCDYAEADSLRTFVVEHRTTSAGYFELRREQTGDVEIVHLGLLPPFIGKGLGGPLLSQALRRAWNWDAKRVWLHTCSKDHPRALDNYLKKGFAVFKTETQE